MLLLLTKYGTCTNAAPQAATPASTAEKPTSALAFICMYPPHDDTPRRILHQFGVCSLHNSGVPGGLVGGPRAYQDQFRGFKSHRVHSRGFFLHKKIDKPKARERELATFDENRQAVGMLNPMRDKKNIGTYRGAEG